MRTELIVALPVAVVLGLAAPAIAQPGGAPDAPPPPPAPAIAGPASWQYYVAPPEAPPPIHRFQLSLGGALRFTGLDTHADASRTQLSEYGWVSARSPVMPTVGGDVEFLLAPIIDLGVAASWSTGDHASGLDPQNDRVSTTTHRFAVVARMHLAMGKPFIPEPRVDVGVLRRQIELHGVTDRDTLPFVRAAVDWRLGNRTGGAQLSLGYTLTGRASASRLDPAVGGLDVGVGPYLRF